MNEINQALPPAMMDTRPEDIKNKSALGKDDFMKLLLVQLQNQDPMKPMDHQEFSAQLAQFSSLEQLTNIGKGIDSLHTGMGEEQKLQALSMIGKRVQATGNELTLKDDKSVSFSYSVPKGIEPLKAVISNAQGEAVREIPLSSKDPSHEVIWDGKSDKAVRLPKGLYTFRVTGVGAHGQHRELNADHNGTVTGVELDGKNAILVVRSDSGTSSRVQLNKVRNVEMDSSEPKIPRIAANSIPGQIRTDGPPIIVPETSGEETSSEDSANNNMDGSSDGSFGFRSGHAGDPFTGSIAGPRR